MGQEDIEVRHEKSAKRFAARVDSKIAYLSYEEKGEGMLDYARTYTPPEFRNRGIAEAITRTAFEYARANNISVVPSCSYVRHFLENHPEYDDLTVEKK
ncbi:MAG: GNAT family N-acetyltransferase [Spirochaetota bacterium]